MGVNHFLKYIGQAVDQRANEVEGALDFIAKIADEVYRRDGGWRDVVVAPRGIGDNPKPPKAEKAASRREHVIAATAFGHRCVQCRRVAFSERGLETLTSSECKMHATVSLVLDSLDKFAVANGHRLWKTGGYVWCARCARHTSRFVRELAAPCSGAAKQRWWRTNLWQGRAPKAKKTDPVIGVPARLTVAEWLQWRFMHEGRGETLEEYGKEPATLTALCADECIEWVDSIEVVG